ncbi:MAG: fumarylacetoacetate hydrolase family protein [Clostridia bacterium]|nr:fumarylacetoacetate hydrolase family protein [Clostridia bacterium]MBR6781118.1 fumarylacetoacetate hydrolase family protein [Clostridia bacterium]
MRLYTIKTADGTFPAVQGTNNTLHKLPFADMNEVIASGKVHEFDELTATDGAYSIDTVAILAPIPNPLQDILCLGINYAAHAEESARFKKEVFEKDRKYSVYFSKRVNEAVPDGGCIPYPTLDDQIDYEAELAFILAKDAKNVKKEDAKAYVFGYTIINDVSARGLQQRHKQFYFAKSLDGFTPMGPCIVTADEFDFEPALNIRSYVNGELRQDSNTSLLLAGIGQILEDLTDGMTLKTCSIVSTGTPSGVGMGFVPPKFLKPGDEVRCEIEGIGSITNKFV